MFDYTNHINFCNIFVEEFILGCEISNFDFLKKVIRLYFFIHIFYPNLIFEYWMVNFVILLKIYFISNIGRFTMDWLVYRVYIFLMTLNIQHFSVYKNLCNFSNFINFVNAYFRYLTFKSLFFS